MLRQGEKRHCDVVLCKIKLILNPTVGTSAEKKEKGRERTAAGPGRPSIRSSEERGEWTDRRERERARCCGPRQAQQKE